MIADRLDDMAQPQFSPGHHKRVRRMGKEDSSIAIAVAVTVPIIQVAEAEHKSFVVGRAVRSKC